MQYVLEKNQCLELLALVYIECGKICKDSDPREARRYFEAALEVQEISNQQHDECLREIARLRQHAQLSRSRSTQELPGVFRIPRNNTVGHIGAAELAKQEARDENRQKLSDIVDETTSVYSTQSSHLEEEVIGAFRRAAPAI